MLLLDVLWPIVRRIVAVGAPDGATSVTLEPAIATLAVLGVRRQTERAALPPHICSSGMSA